MSEAKVEMSAIDRQVLETLKSIAGGFDRIVAAQMKVEDQSKQTAAAGDKLFEKMNSGIASQIKGVAALATSWISVDGAIRLATASYDRYKQQAQSSAEFGQQYAGARSAALLNAPPSMTSDRFDALISRASQISGGRDRVALARAFAPTLSSGSRITPEQQAEFIGLAGRLTIGSDTEMESLANTGVMGAEVLGTNDPRDAIGFMMSGQGSSITPNVNQYGKAAIPVLSAARELGFDPRFALAGHNALQRSAGDIEGSSTATNWIGMMTQMAQLRKPLGLKETAGGNEIFAALQDPKNVGILNNLISYTGSDKIQGEKKFGAGLRSLVTGGATRQEFDAMMGRIVPLEQGDQYTDVKLKQIGGDQNVMAYRLRQALSSAAQGNNADIDEIMRGQVRQGFEELRKSDRYAGVIGDAFDGLSYDVQTATGQDPVDIVLGKLQRQERSLRSKKLKVGMGANAFTGDPGYSYEVDPTKGELAQADRTAELIKLFEAMRDELKAIRASNQEMATGQNAPQPNGTPPLTSGVK